MFQVRYNCLKIARLIYLRQDSKMIQESIDKSDRLNVDRISKLDFSPPKKQMESEVAFSLLALWQLILCDSVNFDITSVNVEAKMTHANTDIPTAIRLCMYHVRRKNTFTAWDTLNWWVPLQNHTASAIAIISQATWKRIGNPLRERTWLAAQNASGHPISILGDLLCTFAFRDLHSNGICYILTSKDLNVLGIAGTEMVLSKHFVDHPLPHFHSPLYHSML